VRADADEGAHQESRIEAPDVHEQTLQDVRVPQRIGTAHPASLVEMRIGALQSLVAAPLQRPPARAAIVSIPVQPRSASDEAHI